MSRDVVDQLLDAEYFRACGYSEDDLGRVISAAREVQMQLREKREVHVDVGHDERVWVFGDRAYVGERHGTGCSGVMVAENADDVVEHRIVDGLHCTFHSGELRKLARKCSAPKATPIGDSLVRQMLANMQRINEDLLAVERGGLTESPSPSPLQDAVAAASAGLTWDNVKSVLADAQSGLTNREIAKRLGADRNDTAALTRVMEKAGEVSAAYTKVSPLHRSFRKTYRLPSAA